jgi:hypothetical protein
MANSQDNRADSFSETNQTAQPGLVRELADFLLHTKKWWLTPIVIILLLVGGLLVLGGTAAAPIIYTLF